MRKLVTQDGPDSRPVWSPDGSRIAFEIVDGEPAFFYTNRVIATVPAGGGAPTALTAAFDEDPNDRRVENARSVLLGVSSARSRTSIAWIPRPKPSTRISPADADGQLQLLDVEGRQRVRLPARGRQDDVGGVRRPAQPDARKRKNSRT